MAAAGVNGGHFVIAVLCGPVALEDTGLKNVLDIRKCLENRVFYENFEGCLSSFGQFDSLA